MRMSIDSPCHIVALNLMKHSESSIYDKQIRNSSGISACAVHLFAYCTKG